MKTAPKTEDLTAKGQQEFAAWLASPQAEPFIYPHSCGQSILIRLAKSEGIYYLYSQWDYRGHGINRSREFVYAGIYCMADGLVYDAHYSLDSLVVDRHARSVESLQNTLRAEVRKAVESAIANDRGNLSTKELNEQEAEQLKYFKESCAADEARRAYLKGEDGSFPFRCRYNPSEWTEDALISYIQAPAAYVQSEAEAYINKYQEAMLLFFHEDDATREAYRAIIDDPQHQAHCVKRIIEATSGTGAKTFRVTIRRDGKEFTFKTEADQFRHDSDFNYSSRNIAAADRWEFEQLFKHQFGRNDYYPEEITRIEYGRTVLYEADRAKD